MRDFSFITNLNERRFAEAFFDHDNWESQPTPYRLSVGTSYRPDFKDHARNVLIEVVGTRQAFSSNRCKYDVFKREYPDLVLEFRSPDGRLYNENKATSRTFGGDSLSADLVTSDHYDFLRSLYGTHTEVSRRLGTTPNHYSFVRKSGRMSGPLRALILSLCSHCQDSPPALPLPAQPQDGAA